MRGRWMSAMGLGLALAASALAQPILDLRDPVSKIAFADWVEVADSEESKEFTVDFPSGFVSSYESNNVVPLRAFVPKNVPGPVPVVLILHYWGARDIKVERSLAGRLAQRGIGSVVMTLPYHLTRAPLGTRSGQLAIQPDPEKLKATMIQATQDVKRTVDFIQSRQEFDGSRIGIVGTSLGALITALAYGVEPRLTHAAFVLGGADLAEIMWSSSLVVEARDSLRRQGYTFERLRAELTSVEPLTYLHVRRESSAFIVSGKYDTIIPASTTQALIAAFQTPKTLSLDTGHYGGIFVQSRVLKEVASYFGTEFSGRPYNPPKRIFAPTLRIGVQATTSSGFDIGVGIDLWKSNQRGDLIGIGLLTPRGPQLFLGGRISSGLTIGVVGGTNRVGIGLLWSRVL
jgi:dienelactone hydrolase